MYLPDMVLTFFAESQMQPCHYCLYFFFYIQQIFFSFLYISNLLLAKVEARLMSIDLSVNVQKEIREHGNG